MHSAPAFALELSPDRLWRRLCRGLAGLSLLTLAIWLVWHVRTDDTDLRLVTALALAAGLCVLPALRTLTGSAGRLVWQPAHGLWQIDNSTPAGPAGTVDCLVDLGDWMLLRHTAPAAPGSQLWPTPTTRWLPLSRRDHPAQWHALRCAVFSPGAARPAEVAAHER